MASSTTFRPPMNPAAAAAAAAASSIAIAFLSILCCFLLSHVVISMPMAVALQSSSSQQHRALLAAPAHNIWPRSRNLTSMLPPAAAAMEQDLMAWVRYHQLRLQAASSEKTDPSPASFLSTTDSSSSESLLLTVSINGASSAHFSSVQAAIDAVPKKNNHRVIIQIAAGVYREKVFIPKTKPYITLQGAGSGLTKITYNDTKNDAGSTQDSATVGVNSDGFIAKGITFENSAAAPGPGAVGRQAVALRINGDMAAFYECSFLGAQDTLYDNHGRHYFENCFIQGSIDFIFGDGQSYYKGCTLNALSINPGSVTAQKRASSSDSSGFSFVGCTITGSGLLYLGRAWGTYSRVVFSYTYMDDIIIPSGWNNWGDSTREHTVFYGQYKCSGPGANENGRVAWSHELTDAEAAPFQTIDFIDGKSWL